MLLNRERAVELMERYDVDALIAATRENVIYLSDFAPWGQAVHKYAQRPNFVVFCRRADQTPALLLYPGEATYHAAQAPWLNEIYTYGGGRTLVYQGRQRPAPKKRASWRSSTRPNCWAKARRRRWRNCCATKV